MSDEIIAAGQGCDVCAGNWQVGRTPERISPTGTPYLLYRCGICGTYWVETERLAKIVSRDEARRLFPNGLPA